uniref:HAT C-terminal dimerisation domain-containing protein n=1 Tax=Lactuca sativa TaxID=4236 RepID=A0A9R1VKP3_LACSA|nr:hypothetical protein LSAT_V11C400187080 [Lactuca sativa]
MKLVEFSFSTIYSNAEKNIEEVKKALYEMYKDTGSCNACKWMWRKYCFKKNTTWWNVHKLKYRVLSKMAMNVLAIPISTITSEATFSVGGILICGGDWIRNHYGIKKKLKFCWIEFSSRKTCFHF